MKPATMTMLAGAVLAAAVVPGHADDDEFTRTNIGSLTLRHHATAWAVAATEAGTTLSCADPDACGRAVIRFEPAAGDVQCSAASAIAASEIAAPEAWSRQVETIRPPGLAVHMATVDLGCRNLAGSPVFACTADRGVVYRISQLDEGCRTPRSNVDAVRELLAGLSARD